MSKGAKIWFGIFLFSFLPYLYIVYVSIFGVEYTWFFNIEQYYGYEAVVTTVLFGCVIPVYPVVLIFQCLYGFVNRKKLSAEKKRIVRRMILLLVIATLLGCVGHFVKDKILIQYHYNKDKAVIETYLKEYFGEKHFGEMQIRQPEQDSLCYRIETPLLNYSFEVWLNEERTVVTSSSFHDDFIAETNLHQKVGDYVTEQWGLPEHIQVGVMVLTMDIKEYNADKSLDDFLKTCNYRLDGFNIDRDIYQQEEIVKIIKNILLQYDEEISTYCQDGMLKIYVRVNDDYHASILVLNFNDSDNECKLIFDGYTDAEGTTIPYEEMVLDLSE